MAAALQLIQDLGGCSRPICAPPLIQARDLLLGLGLDLDPDTHASVLDSAARSKVGDDLRSRATLAGLPLINATAYRGVQPLAVLLR